MAILGKMQNIMACCLAIFIMVLLIFHSLNVDFSPSSVMNANLHGAAMASLLFKCAREEELAAFLSRNEYKSFWSKEEGGVSTDAYKFDGGEIVSWIIVRQVKTNNSPPRILLFSSSKEYKTLFLFDGANSFSPIELTEKIKGGERTEEAVLDFVLSLAKKETS